MSIRIVQLLYIGDVSGRFSLVWIDVYGWKDGRFTSGLPCVGGGSTHNIVYTTTLDDSTGGVVVHVHVEGKWNPIIDSSVIQVALYTSGTITSCSLVSASLDVSGNDMLKCGWIMARAYITAISMIGLVALCRRQQ
jgi:hypothetical protein